MKQVLEIVPQIGRWVRMVAVLGLMVGVTAACQAGYRQIHPWTSSVQSKAITPSKPINSTWTRVVLVLKETVAEPGQAWADALARRSETRLRYVTAAGSHTFAVKIEHDSEQDLKKAMERLRQLHEVVAVDLDGRVRLE